MVNNSLTSYRFLSSTNYLLDSKYFTHYNTYLISVWFIKVNNSAIVFRNTYLISYIRKDYSFRKTCAVHLKTPIKKIYKKKNKTVSG